MWEDHGASTLQTAGKESDATPSLYLTNDGDGTVDGSAVVRPGGVSIVGSLATWFCPAFVHDSQWKDG